MTRFSPFLKGTNTGWVTAEYSMLPGSTIQRKARSQLGRIEGKDPGDTKVNRKIPRQAIDLAK